MHNLGHVIRVWWFMNGSQIDRKLISRISVLQKGNKKGQVELRLVHTIEPASSDFASGDDVGVDGAIWPFLVGYYGDDDDYTLFVIASDAEERFEWIEAIRKGLSMIPLFFISFYLGLGVHMFKLWTVLIINSLITFQFNIL